MITAAVGNEGDVEVYANYTGFMWETAREFKALVVFAEVCCHAVLPRGFNERLVAHSDTASLPCKCACHVQKAIGMPAELDITWGPCAVQHRYYGKSQPFGEPSLTARQSMMHPAAASCRRLHSWLLP